MELNNWIGFNYLSDQVKFVHSYRMAELNFLLYTSSLLVGHDGEGGGGGPGAKRTQLR